MTTCDLSGAPDAVEALFTLGQLVQLGRDERAKLLVELGDAVAYMGGADVKVDREFIDHAPNLKVIGSPATGRDHIDLPLLKERGVELFHIAHERELLDGFTAVAELTFGLLLTLVRHIHPAMHSANEGIWAGEKYAGFQLHKKTLGILGLGRLGSITARIGQGFGMNVLANDVADVSMDGVKMVDLDTLLAESDVLSVNIHLSPETENFVDASVFEKMKKGSILLNTSRGKVINEAALIDALESGHLAAAGLDVIDGEWQPQDVMYRHPLIAYAREHENLAIVPHIGGSTTESIYGARIFMAHKIVEYMNTQEIISINEDKQSVII